MWRTFLHVALQDGSVSEDECVKHGLAGGVERPVHRNVAERFRPRILAVYVEMKPRNQQVQTRPHRPAHAHTHTHRQLI